MTMLLGLGRKKVLRLWFWKIHQPTRIIDVLIANVSIQGLQEAEVAKATFAKTS